MNPIRLADGAAADVDSLPARLYLIARVGQGADVGGPADIQLRALEMAGAPVTFEPAGSVKVFGIDSTDLFLSPARAQAAAGIDAPPFEQWPIHHPEPFVRVAAEGETLTVFKRM